MTGGNGASVTDSVVAPARSSGGAINNRQNRAKEISATATRKRRDRATACATTAAPCGTMAHVTARTNTMGSVANTVRRGTAFRNTGDDGASVTHTAAIRGGRSDTAPRSRQRRAEEMNATATG